jgi:hypothetical protein
MLSLYFLCFVGWLIFEGLTLLVTNYRMHGPQRAGARRLRLHLTALWMLLAALLLAGFALVERNGGFGAT